MEWWLQAVIGLLAFLAVFTLYASRNFFYWKKRGVKYVPPRPFIGSFPLQIFGKSKNIFEMDIENDKKYGKLYGFYEAQRPILIVAEPELIRDITIKDFFLFINRREFDFADEIFKNILSILRGDQWKRVRAKVSPAFSSGKMRKMALLIKECAETTCKNFSEITETQKPHDVKKIFGAFTMDVIATTAFGIKLDSLNDPDNPFVKNARKIFSQENTFVLLILVLFPRLLNIIGKFLDDPSTFFKDITEKIIKERSENSDIKRYDFLQLLLDELNDDQSSEIPLTDPQFKGLAKVEIVAQAVIFFIAGYETTASTLANCVYNLALNPDCQDRLVAEVDKVLSDPDVTLDYDSVKSLHYLDAVISETLRFYPPASRLERQASSTYKLGHTGIEIPKGMIVQFPVHAMHHSPDFFPDPEKFDPERFLPENRENIRPFTYMPFGEGPRNCVAERFALLEVKLCLAKVFQHFRFSRVPETKVPLEFYFNQGLLVARDVTLLVEKRSS